MQDNAVFGAEVRKLGQRNTTGEFLQFLGIASGSLAETETLLILADKLGMLDKEQTRPLKQQAAEVGRMLSGLKRSLRLKA